MPRQAPQVACNDCGKPLGRSWRPFLLCPGCRAARAAAAGSEPLSGAHRQERLDALEQRPAPPPYGEWPEGF